jgi:hypothetical protein
MEKKEEKRMRMHEREIKREEKEINTEKERERKMRKERGWITYNSRKEEKQEEGIFVRERGNELE